MSNDFAVVESGGHQYRVCERDYVVVDKLDVPIGEEVVLDSVVLIGDTVKGSLLSGSALASACVSARVVEHRRLPKVVIFKKKRRQNYRRKGHFRADCTVLHVEGIHRQGRKKGG